MDDEPMWAADRVVAPTLSSAITTPETANEFAIKGNHLTLVKGNQFDCRTKIDPHKHIYEFLGICDMFKYRDTDNEAIRLMMFPLSLTGEAKKWLDKLNEETWDELRTVFNSRFFHPALFDRLLEEIRAFSQHKNESLTDAWLRMKEMIKNCHGHNLSKGNIIKIFNHGLNEITQEVLNVTTGGIFLYKTPNQAYQLLEDKVLLKLDWAKNQKTKSSLKKTIAFATEADNYQASIQNLETKFDRLADKQSGRPSGSLPSNTQPNPKGSSSQPYQPHQVSDKDKTGLGYKAASPTVEGFVNSSKILEKQENKSDKGNHEVFPPFTGNYMPSKHDLRLIDEHFESESVDVLLFHQVMVNTAKGKVVVNVVKGNGFNGVKASACWEWRPKKNVLDHVSKHNNASMTLERLYYIDAQGRSKLGSTNSDDEDEEPTPQPKLTNPKPVKETPILKPYKPKTPYPQRLRKDKMEAQYGKFLDLIRVVGINHCKDANLVFNWEKCHFMVNEGIVLGHKVSSAGLEVDKEKIKVISKLPPPTNMKDKKGTENVVADHLTRIDNDETSDDSEVDDNFPGETLIEIKTKDEPWFADFANYLVGDIVPKGMTYQQKNKLFFDLKHYFWEEPYLFKVCSDGMIRRCISGLET
nr:reverse transcriptase domain-containing protein [Tanacetum cinerariifolium]